MCLTVPMRIIRLNGYEARCSAKGAERDVSLFLLGNEPLAVGDFVLVHLGYATQKVDPETAREMWELFDGMLASEAAAP